MQGAYETHVSRTAGEITVAEHSVNTGHRIDFSSISVLDRATGYMHCLVKEAGTVDSH